MFYNEIIDEAPASDVMRQQIFYHGTPNDERGRNILKQGIIPGNQNALARGKLLPVIGRSYLTGDLKYGVIYCLGANMLGAKDIDRLIDRDGRYGWLFVINGDHLHNDVQPDEDSVGEFFANHTERGWDHTTKPWRQLPPKYKPDGVEDDIKVMVWHNIRHSLTDQQFQNAIDGHYSAWSSGGKRALKRLSDHDKLALIRWGAHVAYQGPVVPDQAWRFDKRKNSTLAEDGSNFFAVAKQIR